MQEIPHALKSYGLNEKETAVYLACVGKNALSAQEIADRTVLSRQVVYDHMKRLIHDGLIVTFRTGTSLRYQATKPVRLLENLEQKAALLKEALPALERLQQHDTVPSTAEIHRGTTALRNVLLEALTSKQELLWMTDHTQAHELFYEHDFHNLTLKRIATRTPIKTLIGSARIAPEELAVWKTDPESLRETRTSPLIDGMRTTTIIYANKIVMMDMNTTSPQAIVITDQEIAQTQRKLFLELWNRSKNG